METVERHERISDAANRASNMANAIADKGAQFAHQAAEKGAELKKAIVDKGAEALDRSGTFIKKNPHTSVMSGFGLGLLIGAAAVYLLTSRRD